MSKDIDLEEKLIGDIDVDEARAKQKKLKIEEAKAKVSKTPKKISSIKELYEIFGATKARKLMYSPDAVYKVNNLNQGTETFVNGDQAEAIKGNTDDYVVEFDHIIIEV